MPEQIFFQSSFPRAGSTLLQNILAQHPDIYVTPTSGVLELLYAARRNYTDLPEFKAQDSDTMYNAFTKFCQYGLYGFFEGITDKKYVVDKSRGWGYYSDFLNSFYSNPKIITMIRDPRAILASMEKNLRKHPEKYKDIINEGEMSGITTEQRIDIWTQNPPVGLAFQRLYQIIKEGRDKNMLFIKFENLTKVPQTEMNRVYEFLDIPPHIHDFDNVQQVTLEDDRVHGIYGDHIIRKKVQPIPNDYNQILGTDASNWVRQHYNWFYEYFSYA